MAHHEKGRREIVSLFRGAPSKRTRYAANPVCRRSSICEANSCRGFPLAGNGNIPYACGVTQVFRLPFSWCAIQANSLRGKLVCRRLSIFVLFRRRSPTPSPKGEGIVLFRQIYAENRSICHLPRVGKVREKSDDGL